MIKQKEEEFRIKSHEFELQKIADLTYILCSERMRCNSEKHEIHQNFEVHEIFINVKNTYQ